MEQSSIDEISFSAAALPWVSTGSNQKAGPFTLHFDDAWWPIVQHLQRSRMASCALPRQWSCRTPLRTKRSARYPWALSKISAGNGYYRLLYRVVLW